MLPCASSESCSSWRISSVICAVLSLISVSLSFTFRNKLGRVQRSQVEWGKTYTADKDLSSASFSLFFNQFTRTSNWIHLWQPNIWNRIAFITFGKRYCRDMLTVFLPDLIWLPQVIYRRRSEIWSCVTELNCCQCLMLELLIISNTFIKITMKIKANNADTVFRCNNLTCWVQYEDVLSLHAGDFLVVLLHLEIKQHLNVDVSLSVSSRVITASQRTSIITLSGFN